MSGATASKISLREQPILMRAAELSDATGPFPDQSRGVFPARDGLVGIRAMSKDAVARYASGALRQPQTARGLEQQQGLSHGRHVVHAQNLHSLPSQAQGHADRAGERIRVGVADRLGDEAFA